MNALIAEARRMALSKGLSPASKGTCGVCFLLLQSRDAATINVRDLTVRQMGDCGDADGATRGIKP